jgi:hypothetical protein
MSEIISQIEQVTPAWLTRRLRQTGVLAQGRVATIQVLESSTSNPSTHYRLAVQYTPANIDGPGVLFNARAGNWDRIRRGLAAFERWGCGSIL